MTSRNPLIPGLVAALATLATSGAVHADAPTPKWTWSVMPYAWATNVGVDVSIDDHQVVNETIPVSDLVKQLDATAQLHFEGQHGANGFLFDIFAVKLSEDGKSVALPAATGGSAVLDTELRMAVYEVGGLFDPKGDQNGFALLYGVRILDEDATIDAQLTIDPNAPTDRCYEMGDTLFDALVGVRYIHRFDRHWSVAARLDASSSGTRLTWAATSTVAYAFGKRGQYAVTGGYRRMDFNFKDEDPLQVDMSLSGFFAGFRFTF